MGARHKLNQVNVITSLVLATVLGISADSWVVFGIALCVLVAASVHSGDIRPDQGGRR